LKKRVLVTGGLGYVGGRVALLLAARNDIEIVLGSRKLQSSPYWLPAAHVAALDWHSKKSLVSTCDGIDTLVHLAAMNNAECARDPLGAIKVNTLNTARLIEAAKVSGVRRVIYFSTAHVYGPNLVGRIDETTLTKCRQPYAYSHRAAEDIVLAAANDNLTTIVIRLSNGFGAPAHPAVNAWMLLVNDLCRQAVTVKSLSLKSSGLQELDFVTLLDVSKLVSFMLDLPKVEVGDGLFNMGNGKSTRVIDMARLIQKRCATMMGFTPEIHSQQTSDIQKTNNLDYRIDKLLKTGFSLSSNMDEEVDAILQMCHEVFVIRSTNAQTLSHQAS
jgi:UDP-glucose 4-epimerase